MHSRSCLPTHGHVSPLVLMSPHSRSCLPTHAHVSPLTLTRRYAATGLNCGNAVRETQASAQTASSKFSHLHITCEYHSFPSFPNVIPFSITHTSFHFSHLSQTVSHRQSLTLLSAIILTHLYIVHLSSQKKLFQTTNSCSTHVSCNLSPLSYVLGSPCLLY